MHRGHEAGAASLGWRRNGHGRELQVGGCEFEMDGREAGIM